MKVDEWVISPPQPPPCAAFLVFGGDRVAHARLWHHKNPTFGAVADSLDGLEADDYEPTISERVYALLDPEACQIKIGWTKDVPRRQRDLERQRGRKLELLGTMTGGYNLERAMHGRFREHRREANEWYSSEIIRELVPLLDAA